MVDATDLKSVDRKIVRVQVPLPPLKQPKRDCYAKRNSLFLVVIYHASIIFCIVFSASP